MEPGFSKTFTLSSCKKLNGDITIGEQVIASSAGALATSLFGLFF